MNSKLGDNRKIIRYSPTLLVIGEWSNEPYNRKDAPDSLAMLAQLVQDISRTSIKVLNRRDLGL
ncbi:MAG TPA: hypothetical protein VFC79_02035 [Tissierellaceae bacterium]|nr:hypothetical protein [Tissierellaceae bacterium]